MTADACETTFHQEPAILLTWGDFQATVLPDIGGNLISFRETRRNFKFLREPDTEQMDAFRATPYLYGIPVLFPPNRYDHGSIPFAGTHYQLPINEPSKQNHLHGFLYDIPWQVEDFGKNQVESYVVLAQTIDDTHSRFHLWPHSFKIRLRYGLGEFGLSQHVFIYNTGRQPIPCLLGFHTAINVPFADNSCATDYCCRVSIGERWELDDRALPTGRRLELSVHEQRLQQEGVNPFAEPMDNHYTADITAGPNRMELSDTHNEVTLIYDVGGAFRHWMIWNNRALPGFFCAEPQVNVVNAPNVALPAEEIGLVPIGPGETWEATSRMYLRLGVIKGGH